MEILSIFEIVKNSLLAVQFDDKEENEFRNLFNLWKDYEFLESFFEDNLIDLNSGFYEETEIENAVLLTIDDAKKTEKRIFELATKGQTNTDEVLQNIFKPLISDSFDITLERQKAYGLRNKSWLRIYAIRISPNRFVITGGAIKLTKTMNDREHLIKELEKLEIAKKYLKENYLIEESDFYYSDIIRSEE